MVEKKHPLLSRIHEKTQSLCGDTDEHGPSKHFGGERTLYLPDYIIYCAPKLCQVIRPKNMSDLFSHVVTPTSIKTICQQLQANTSMPKMVA